MRSAIIALVLLLGVVCASAATCSSGQTEVSFSSSSSTGAATKLILANKLGFNADIQYVYVSGSTLGVTVTGCADAALAKKLGFAWSTSGDAITLTASSDGKSDTPSGTVGNSASKLAPLTTFMALAFGLLLVIRPKSVSSVVLIMAILGVAMYAQADSTATITIKISVPDSIASVCNSATDCTARTPGSVPYVNVMGDRYATMDLNTACDTSKVLSLPAGWRIATATDATVFAAIAFNTWDTTALILADGNAYTNNKNSVVANANAFTAVDGGYKVNTCNQKILIIQSFTYSNTQPSVVATLSVSNYVTFNGYDYATADNIAYNSASTGSQAGGIFISTSNAWQVAPFEDSTVVALSKSTGNFFGCACAVFSSGNGYTGSFEACGTSQLVSVSVSGGAVVGVAGSKQRIVIRRASTASNSFFAASVITNSYVYNGVEYATLDNKDYILIDADNCQSRFYSLPAGYTIATAPQLYDFILGTLNKNVYTNTTVFVSTTTAYNRALEVVSAALVTKTVGPTTFYNTNTCARVLISRSNTAKADFTLGMKLLFISQSADVNATDSGEVALVKTMMQATGTPYDWLYLTDANYNKIYPGALPLFDANGNPKYYGIVASLSNPMMKINGGQAPILDEYQKAQIRQYQFLYGVRMVALNGLPIDYAGMTAAGSNILNGTVMSIVPAFATAHADLFGGVQSTAMFNTSNQYYSWIGSTGSWTVENFLTMQEFVGDAVVKVVAAIITEPTTKTQTLQFFVGNADFLDHGPVLANVWLTWVTRGIWLGNRRIYLSAQIDDYFLATGQYGQTDNDAHSVRINGTDVALTVSYLNQLNTKAPGGNVTLAMAVNCAEAEQGLAPTLITAAQLYKDFFFWESHTWTHLDFTRSPEDACDLPVDSEGYSRCHNTTQDEATQELVKNNNYVQTVLFPEKGLDTRTWSKNSMITPAITGLFNPAALAALNATGMTCVVGDNSRPELVPANPYLGMFTNVNFNGFDGIFIIPRYATEIYYNSATPENNMKQYNERYGPNRLPQFTKEFFNYNSTLDDLLAREAETNFRHLAFFRHDPYMFHQCNLNHFPYTYVKDNAQKQWSLVSLWLESLVDRYNQMLTFPMINVKQQDLRDVYFARREREFCGLSGSIAVSGGSTSSVTITSTAGCEASLTGPTSCGSLSGCRTETYGPDSTVWATMVAGAGKQVPVSKAWTN